MSSRATSFYYSFPALPKGKRDAIAAAPDFAAPDDAVDEADGDEAAQGLTRWREELARLYEGGTPVTEQAVSCFHSSAQFKLPRTAFEDLIDGVSMDLEQRRYDTFEALRQYCLRVASAVGLICVEIFGYRDVQSRDYAVDLGIALQLTNIIRDVGADLQRGRLYLPLEDLRRFGCTEEDLRAGVVTEHVRNLLAFQCERARQYYRKAEQALPRPDARGLIAARIMAATYAALLNTIERSRYDVFRRRIRVWRPRQAMIAALTWLKIRLHLT